MTFRGSKAIEGEVTSEALALARATTKLEVGEETSLEEGEIPQIETVTGRETTGGGMKNKPQVQVQGTDHTEAVRDGRRSLGETTRQTTPKDNPETRETTGITDMRDMKKTKPLLVNITPETTIPEKEIGVLVPDNTEGETTALDMSKREEEEAEITVQVIEVTEVTGKEEMVGGSMAMTNEETAQGP